MPRRLRIHLPGGLYHVTLRGNHQRAIFDSEDDRALLNKIVARSVERFGVRVHAYCWMSNHVHIVMQAGAEPLANPMRNIASEYARAMQAKIPTTGHFFERRYHATLVDADSYLLELLRYVHLNPVRAGVTRNVVEYPWSSHHTYIGTRVDSWVTTEFCLGIFSADRARAIEAYKNFLASEAGREWEPVGASVGGGDVLGDDDFIARVQRLPTAPPRRQSLDELLAEACARFGIDSKRLDSPVRDAYLTKVRAWIAHQANVRGVATRSAVARALGRTESTLRHAIRAYPNELE